MRRVNGEGTGNVLHALAGRDHLSLAARALCPTEQGRFDGRTGEARDGVGKLGRLIVSSGDEAAPMQRHGDEHVGALKRFAARAYHPACEERYGFQAIAVLEAQNEIPAGIVIGKRGAGDDERRRAGDAGRAFHASAQIMREWEAALDALRGAEEAQFAPALGAGGLWF